MSHKKRDTQRNDIRKVAVTKLRIQKQMQKPHIRTKKELCYLNNTAEQKCDKMIQWKSWALCFTKQKRKPGRLQKII